MPTPSNNGPDPQSPRSYPFSTCPDPDEQASSTQPQQIQRIHSPSSWRPHPPPFAGSDTAMDEDVTASRSRSTSISPRAQSNDAQDRDREEPEGMVITPVDTEDDGQKPTDTDEEMLMQNPVGGNGAAGGGDGASSSVVGLDGGGAISTGGRHAVQDGVSPRRTTRRPAGAESSRRRQLPEMISPVSIEVDQTDGGELSAGGPPWYEDTALLGMGYECADTRVIPVSPSSYLRPGSRFHGTQQSERQRYDVQVEIKHVDLRESFLCGYLRIQGLTEDHPTLTTYFEGEIIGTKYGFKTQHASWGASDKDDLSHWAKFTAFRPFAKQARKGGQVIIKDVAQRENIFMRWKEHFLVPDHRVRTINGASFEGFYYICFNQVRGEVSGIYFHKNSEKFQQLELKHVEDRGCFGAMEFR